MRNFIIYGVIALILFTAGGIYIFGGNGQEYEFIVVDTRDVVQEVSVTGKVKPVSSVSLAFDRVGRISRFNVDVGSHVVVGQILASLDNSDIVAELEQAEARVKAEEARLDELRRGTRDEEIQINLAQVDSASFAVSDAKSSLIEKINDSYTKSDDAIRNRIDRMFNNPKSSNPKLSFVISDLVLSDQLEFGRFVLEGVLNSWSLSLANMSADGDLSKYISEASSNLEQIKSFLDKMSLAVNGLVANSSLSQTTIDTYKSETATARVNTNTAISNLLVAREKLRAAESSLKVAEQQLALKRAGATAEQIRAQEAVLGQVRASVDGARALLAKTILRSPIDGVVTGKNFEVGEIVSANTPVLSIISDNQFEMEANISEADIAKVVVGDDARVTLDAYGPDVVFLATVTKIDPAETILEGVATYKTTFQFKDNDDRVRSGMTANIDILTDRKEKVVAVPQRSILSRDGERFVMKDVGGAEPQEVRIQIGLRGSDGYTEVLSGVSSGDRIVGLIK